MGSKGQCKQRSGKRGDSWGRREDCRCASSLSPLTFVIRRFLQVPLPAAHRQELTSRSKIFLPDFNSLGDKFLKKLVLNAITNYRLASFLPKVDINHGSHN